MASNDRVKVDLMEVIRREKPASPSIQRDQQMQRVVQQHDCMQNERLELTAMPDYPTEQGAGVVGCEKRCPPLGGESEEECSAGLKGPAIVGHGSGDSKQIASGRLSPCLCKSTTHRSRSVLECLSEKQETPGCSFVDNSFSFFSVSSASLRFNLILELH